MKLPIYSNLKTKLESKGLDSSTSGQIAWFVCSVGVVYVFSMIVYTYGVNKEGISLDKIFVAFYINHFFCFIFMWLIFLLNLLYKENTISFILSMIITIIYFYNEYFSCIVALIIGVILYITKKQRLFYTCFVGLVYIIVIYIVFDLRGGFYK
ncbi:MULTISPECIES: hypothetical protein [Helicobacter]|uniref:Uncharacterized protein n=1 Tax=Helicobacter bilis ATCC 43879 TaxID=613026 RepID=C3XIR0_9HELI|nr:MULTISPECIES: hypothetical protein [Helicobacter]EEO24899.1 hypothetical protein HRAG_01956 [Helicobacter bilis ATCC 43879]